MPTIGQLKSRTISILSNNKREEKKKHTHRFHYSNRSHDKCTYNQPTTQIELNLRKVRIRPTFPKKYKKKNALKCWHNGVNG